MEKVAAEVRARHRINNVETKFDQDNEKAPSQHDTSNIQSFSTPSDSNSAEKLEDTGNDIVHESQSKSIAGRSCSSVYQQSTDSVSMRAKLWQARLSQPKGLLQRSRVLPQQKSSEVHTHSLNEISDADQKTSSSHNKSLEDDNPQSDVTKERVDDDAVEDVLARYSGCGGLSMYICLCISS